MDYSQPQHRQFHRHRRYSPTATAATTSPRDLGSGSNSSSNSGSGSSSISPPSASSSAAALPFYESSSVTPMTEFRVRHHWRVDQFNVYRRHFEPCQRVPSSPTFYALEHGLRFEVELCPAGSDFGVDYHYRSQQQQQQQQQLGRGKVDNCNILPPDVCLTSTPFSDSAAAHLHWKEGAFIMLDAEVNVIRKNGSKHMVWLKKYKQAMTGGGRGNVSNYFCFDLDHSFFGANDSLELVFDIFGHYTSDLYSGVFTPSLPNYHLLSGNNAGNGHSQTMKSLLERGAGSDLKLVVMKKKKQQEQQQQDQQQPGTANDDDDADDNSVTTFNVHQLYLTAHSVVFEAMLLRNGNTREAQERRVVIRDLSAKTVHSLLLFIYTGALAAEEDFTLELLSAADKYEVTALKVACEQQLSLQLTTDSVFAHLVHADRHNAPTLKENCLKFVVFHAAELIISSSSSSSSSSSGAWHQFTATAPSELIFEVLERVFAQANNHHYYHQ